MAKTEKIVRENRNRYGGNGVAPHYVSLIPHSECRRERINKRFEKIWNQPRQCVSCNYEWSGQMDGICPSCGSSFTVPEPVEEPPDQPAAGKVKYNTRAGEWFLWIMVGAAALGIIGRVIWKWASK